MPKQPMHQGDLSNLFHTVAEYGAATVRSSDLLRWLGRDRQSSGFWAEIHECFQEALQPQERSEGWQLMVIDHGADIVFACLDPEGTELKNLWWQRVRMLAERPSPGRRNRNQEDA